MRNCGKITNEGVRMISNLKRLEKLMLTRCENMTDEGADILSGMSSLKKLWIWQSGVRDVGIERLVQMKGLQILDVGWCELTDVGMKWIGDMIWLERLELNNCSKITSDGFQVLGGLVNLRKLNLSRCKGVNDDVLCMVGRLSKLEVLDLRGCKDVSDEGVQKMCNLGMLRELRLERTNIGDKSLDLLSSLGKLEELNIKSCEKVTDKGICMLKGLKILTLDRTEVGVNGLNGLENLENLSLVGCKQIMNEDMNVLGIRMRILDLSSTNISDEGVHILCEKLSIIDLNLNTCCITDESMRSLGRSRSLRVLSIDCCRQIDNCGLEMLKESQCLERLILGSLETSLELVEQLKRAAFPRIFDIVRWKH